MNEYFFGGIVVMLILFLLIVKFVLEIEFFLVWLLDVVIGVFKLSECFGNVIFLFVDEDSLKMIGGFFIDGDNVFEFEILKVFIFCVLFWMLVICFVIEIYDVFLILIFGILCKFVIDGFKWE